MELKEIAKEIRDVISQYQKNNSLSFIEDTHTYYIKGRDGKIVSNLPSVSTVLHCFYDEFDATTTRAFKNCLGDKEKETKLLKEWADTGVYASSMGSRVHYLLEKHLVGLYGSYKEVRQPIFECDEEQTSIGDIMITSGKEFIDLMHDRGAVLLDTEIVLGSSAKGYGYTGQPDKVWLMEDKNGNAGIVVTDWKTNKKKNFQTQSFTKPMRKPFESYPATTLAHYYIQLPLYVKLLLKMLEGSKYENIPFFGAVVVLLEREGGFEEYRIPKDIISKVIDMDVEYYLEKNDLLTKKGH